jgi:predicted NBD/HSP70 family sugar kinase
MCQQKLEVASKWNFTAYPKMTWGLERFTYSSRFTMVCSMGPNNATAMKNQNRLRILRLLRRHTYSRADLARMTGLTRAAIGVIVDQLLSEKMLLEGSLKGQGVGRPSVSLQYNPRVSYSLGIDISRSGYSLGIVDFSGNVCSQVHNPLNLDLPYQRTLESMEIELRDLVSFNTPPGAFLGLGITAPGPLDVKNGIILSPPNLGSWKNVEITRFFTERLGCLVLLENNANALALAEKSFGLGREHETFMQLVVDSGIGAGLILNGELTKGATGFGNEFGHISMTPDGPYCSCGNRGCFELYASIPNLVSAVQRNNPELNTWERIVSLAKSGHLAAKNAIELEADYLAGLIVTAVNILDLQVVVICGEIGSTAEGLRLRISEKVNSRVISRGSRKVSILESHIEASPPVLSSANLVVEHLLRGPGPF